MGRRCEVTMYYARREDGNHFSTPQFDRTSQSIDRFGCNTIPKNF